MSENLNEIEAPACPECSENYTYEMGELWACPMCGHEWERTAAGETEEEAGSKVLDSVGNELVDGDSVTIVKGLKVKGGADIKACLLYTSPSPRDQRGSRMPSSA